MKRTRTLIAIQLSAWLLLGTFAAAASAQDVSSDDPARWAPADAVFFLGIADTDVFWEQVKQTALYRATQDDAAKQAVGQFDFLSKLIEGFRKRLAESLDVGPDQLRNPFGGPFAIYGTAPATAEKEAFGLVMIASVDDHALMEEYYEKATGKFRGLADDASSVDFAGQKIDVFETREHSEDEKDDAGDSPPHDPNSNPFGGNDPMSHMLDEVFGEWFSPEAMPEKLAFCLTDNRLVVAQTADQIKDALRRERSGETLAEADVYKSLVRTFDKLGQVRFLLNIPKLVEVARTQGENTTKELEAFGVRSMDGLVGHLTYGGETFESKLEAVLLLHGERAGLPKILSMKNSPIAPPKDVSRDSLAYASINVDVIETIDEVERIVRQMDPEAADEMHEGMGKIDTPAGPYDMRKEVLENLRAPLTFRMGIAKPYAPSDAGVLATIGHRDRAAMLRFAELMRQMGAPLTDREEGGNTVYDVMMGGISLCPTNDALLVGSTNSVDAQLHGDADNPLSAEPGFVKAAKASPDEAWGVLYMDQRRMFEAAVEVLREREAFMAASMQNPAAMMILMAAQNMMQGVDREKLDEARAMAKYHAPTMITLATTAEGIRFTQVQLKADAE